MLNLCIIPARGGSKRIPRKNIKPFCGKPIIEYSIETAKSAEASRGVSLFDEIMISTDDQEMADIAAAHGISVPFFRSNLTSGDDAPLVAVVLEVLNHYEDEGKKPLYICLLYATAPLVTSEHLSQGYSILSLGKYDAAYPIIKNNWHIEQTLVLKGNQVRMLWPKYLNINLHDGLTTYRHASQWFWIDARRIRKTRTLTPHNSGYVLLRDHEYHDIDTPDDWDVAEKKYKLHRELAKSC